MLDKMIGSLVPDSVIREKADAAAPKAVRQIMNHAMAEVPESMRTKKTARIIAESLMREIDRQTRPR